MSAGFVPGAGTDFHSGQESEIARRLDQLGRKLGITIYGISGARTPAHSVAVGGFANDPHTRGQAADIGVNGMTRASAGQLTDAQLASVGLYRPFAGAAEINHVQLKPSGGGGGSGAKSIGQDAVAGAAAGAAGGAFLGPEGAAIGAAGGAVVGAAAGVIGGKAADAAANVAIHTAESVIGSDTFKHAALYVVLVVGGLALLVTGVSRAAGVKPPNPLKHVPLPVPV